MFQFTLPCGERPDRSSSYPDVLRFQFTLPCGERLSAVCGTICSWTSFNSRSRAGSDTHTQGREGHSPCFNSRSRAGSDTGGYQTLPDFQRFNSRSRAGSDLIGAGDSAPGIVSIHAPVRGATRTTDNKDFSDNVSIHAPVRGATALQTTMTKKARVFQFTLPCGERRRQKNMTREQCEKFQFTLPCGERPNDLASLVDLLCVSIHAPVRGATFVSKRNKTRLIKFQFTLPCGERLPGVHL